jgi:16S rRNA (guanine966-N2)-methyltransferase
MRVIAGEARGIRLGPVPAGTRPVSDRAREGLFASLGARVPGARCLDLFAGTGAVGIEALSRGATSCTFVDRSRAAATTIVRVAAVERYLTRPPAPQARVDLVFLDPPYETLGSTLAPLLASLDDGWLEGERWTVVVTRGQKGSLPAVPVHWAAGKQLRYGDSFLTLYREVGWA